MCVLYICMQNERRRVYKEKYVGINGSNVNKKITGSCQRRANIRK